MSRVPFLENNSVFQHVSSLGNKVGLGPCGEMRRLKNRDVPLGIDESSMVRI